MKTLKTTALSALLGLMTHASFGATYTNEIVGASFNPQNMTVKAGDTIVWINVAGHTVSGRSPGEAFCGDTFFFDPADTCTATFNVPGTYNYACNPHEIFGMVGTVTVEPVFKFTRIQPASGTNVSLAWDGSPGPYALQKKEAICEAGWRDVSIGTAKSAIATNEADNLGFFRITDIASLPNVPFSTYMSGAMERPTVATAGTGSGTLRLEGNTLYFDIRYQNLSGTANAAHIHGPSPAALGNAPVMIDLGSFNGGSFGTNGTLSGSVTVNAVQKMAILSGKTYVNVHTANNGGGEIRGQIAPVLMQAAISGPGERPPRPSLGLGQSTMLLVGTNLTFNITYSGLTASANNAHIHGPADIAGSASVMRDLVVFHDGPLAAQGSFGGTMGLTPQQLEYVLDGRTYVNIHTGNFPSGEVRGQITPKVTAIPLTASLSGAAETPAITTAGTGIATLRIEGDNLLFEVRYKNLTSIANGCHIHGPANSSNNAPVLIHFTPFNIGPLGTNGAFAGTVPLTPEQKTMILNGQTYINVHTANNGNGEIRGQIGTVLMNVAMDGAQENPVVPTSGTGSGTLLLVGNSLTFDITYRNLSGTANNAHFHGPAPVGENNTVLIDLVPYNGGSFGTSGSLVGTLTIANPAHLGYMIDGLTYANIHSTFRSGGEIRGQVKR